MLTLRADALEIFRAALAAADAGEAVRRHLERTGNGLRIGDARFTFAGHKNVSLLAVGKAAPEMAEAIEKLVGDRLGRALVVTKHAHAHAYRGRCEIVEAGHPVPDGESLRAGQSVLALIDECGAEDLLIVAISGGASSLLCAPVDGISLEAKQATTDMLLRAGADIHELNCVRKHLSKLKGGNLARLAHPRRVLGLILSDVVGDRLDVIGSGLTAPDPTTYAQGLKILSARGVLGRIPPEVKAHFEAGAAGQIAETPKPEDGVFANVTNFVVGGSRQALDAAATEARRLGYRTLILSSRFEGETRDVARFHARILWEAIESNHPVAPPLCLLSGGETTVTVRGSGKGGRNQEFALAAAIQMAGAANIACLSAGTDGTDGPTDAAGALAFGDTVARAAKLGMRAEEFLAANNSYAFFAALGDLVKTGPTGTNVMDVNIMLAGER